MKVKDLIKELSFFDDEDNILAYYDDEETGTEYECEFKVGFNGKPYLDLEEIARYGNDS